MRIVHVPNSIKCYTKGYDIFPNIFSKINTAIEVFMAFLWHASIVCFQVFILLSSLISFVRLLSA